MPERVFFDVPMDQYTSLQIGGPADVLVFPRDRRDLEILMGIIQQRDIPYVVMGKGTNLLVKDQGIRGLVVNFSSGFREIGVAEKTIHVGAGTLLTEMIGLAMERGLSGLSPLCGIPGTVGGGLAMNAGAWGSDVGERIESITVINGDGRIRSIPRDKLAFGYRELHLPKGTIILEGTFIMEPARKEKIREEMEFYQQKRSDTQPLQFPSAGSIFRNPPEVPAGRIIEELGLKGKKVGGAEVSRIHGNFIINTGGAKASHVLELIHLIQEKALHLRGVTLEPEVRIVGEG
jgi:UDP-N-acetylmuramate dehydrogenase